MRQFALCRLYNFRVVDKLPASCPIRCGDGCLAEIQRRKDWGWAKLGMIPQDLSGAAEINRAEICYRCKLHSLPRVRQLAIEAEPQTTTSKPATPRPVTTTSNKPAVRQQAAKLATFTGGVKRVS